MKTVSGFTQMNQDQQEEKYQEQKVSEPSMIQSSQKKYRSFQFFVLAISNISLSSFYFGYMMVYLSIIDFQVVLKVYSINMPRSYSEGILTSCVPLGGLIGAYLSSYFINNLSRKTTILYINYLAFGLGIFLFFADFKMLMLIRVGQGICAGCFSSVIPLIIKELAPFELSGFFGVFHQLFITMGIFFCCFFTYLLSIITNDSDGESYWKLIFAFPILTVTLQILNLKTVFNFETPKYLVQTGQISKAQDLLAKLYERQYVQSLLTDLSDQKRGDDKGEIVVKKELILPKKIAIHLALLQQFVGINAVITYGRQIAEGSLSSFKPILPSILNFQQVVAALLSSFLLTKYGRKTILQAGTLGAIIANLIIAFGFWINDSFPSASVVLILGALFFYIANFGFSLGPIVWMYIPEVVQQDFLPISTMVNWGGATILVLLFPILKAHLPGQNPSPLFLFFAVWSILGYYINEKYVVETQEKSERQIFLEYQALEKEIERRK